MCIISTNAVQGRLSKNYLTQIFIAQNIFDTKYSRFMVFAARNWARIEHNYYFQMYTCTVMLIVVHKLSLPSVQKSTILGGEGRMVGLVYKTTCTCNAYMYMYYAQTKYTISGWSVTQWQL